MADLSFDAVVVGTGVKSIATAMYLSKYGKMDVACFDQDSEVCGGWSSAESAPGFVANTHSSGHSIMYLIPLERDFPEIKEMGADYVTPRVSGQAFDDGTCLMFYRQEADPDQQKTAAEIARFSQKDADYWLALWKWWQEKAYDAYIQEALTLPTPLGVPSPVETLMMEPDSLKLLNPIFSYMDPFQVFNCIFESDEMISFFTRGVSATGGGNEPTQGLFSLLGFMMLLSSMGTVRGGTHQMAHACSRVLLQNGVKIFTRSEVIKILVENGQAKGIRLKDGTEIEAKRLVVTGISPLQLLDMAGEKYFPDDAKIIKNLRYEAGIRGSWYQGALSEHPQWNAASFNPDINDAFLVMMGPKDPEVYRKELDLEKIWSDEIIKDPLVYSMDFSNGNPSTIPDGGGCALLTEAHGAPPADAFSEKQWMEYQKKHADYLVKTLSKYASNIDWDKVYGYLPVTGYWIAQHLPNMHNGCWCILQNGPWSQMGRNRPTPNLSSHRTPVEKLYATGGGWDVGFAFPWGGYRCYKAIADDFGLGKPWEKNNYPY
jgi:phytoene dehydrogenase-like protein